MTRRKDLCHHDGLYTMKIFVVMDLAVDLVLNDLVPMWLDHFVCDGYVAVSTCLARKVGFRG